MKAHEKERLHKIERSGAAWVVMHWTGHLYIETAARRRRDAIHHFMMMVGRRKETWSRDFGRFGVYRCVKTKVIPDFVAVNSRR